MFIDFLIYKNTYKYVGNVPSMVTNKKKRLKNNQACLKLFFKRFFFQSGALREIYIINCQIQYFSHFLHHLNRSSSYE